MLFKKCYIAFYTAENGQGEGFQSAHARTGWKAIHMITKTLDERFGREGYVIKDFKAVK